MLVYARYWARCFINFPLVILLQQICEVGVMIPYYDEGMKTQKRGLRKLPRVMSAHKKQSQNSNTSSYSKTYFLCTTSYLNCTLPNRFNLRRKKRGLSVIKINTVDGMKIESRTLCLWGSWDRTMDFFFHQSRVFLWG